MLRHHPGKLALRSGTDHYLVHINIGGLLDRERNRAGDRIRGHREPVTGRLELRFHVRIGHAVGEVGTKLGEMIVTHTRLRTADPSRRPRSLRSFVLARDDSSEKNSARLVVPSQNPKAHTANQVLSSRFSVLINQDDSSNKICCDGPGVEGAAPRVTCRG